MKRRSWCDSLKTDHKGLCMTFQGVWTFPEVMSNLWMVLNRGMPGWNFHVRKIMQAAEVIQRGWDWSRRAAEYPLQFVEQEITSRAPIWMRFRTLWQNKWRRGVPCRHSGLRTWLVSMRMQVCSLVSLSVSCGVGRRYGLDPVWLWCRLAAAAPIRSLAWELPYVAGAALKREEKNKIGILQLVI